MGRVAERIRAPSRPLLAFAVATLVTPLANAEPLAAVELTGNCPSEAEIGAALSTRRLPPEASGFRLLLVEVPGGADITLSRGSSETVLERRILSNDCHALGDAAALITEAYFIELKAQAMGEPAVTAAGKAAEAGSPEPAPGPTPAPAPPPEKLAPPPTTPRQEGPSRADAATPPAGAVMRFGIALAGGAELYPEEGNVAAVGQLGLGLWLTRALELEAHGVLASSTTIGTTPNRVSRVERRAALRALGWMGGAPSLAAWGGFGLAFTSVKALDVAVGPTEVAGSPLVEGGFALRQPVGSGIALGAELGCHVLLTREQYVVEPDGQIGVGPRFACALLAGATWTNR